VPLFRFRKGGFFVSEGHEKIFSTFLKNTLLTFSKNVTKNEEGFY